MQNRQKIGCVLQSTAFFTCDYTTRIICTQRPCAVFLENKELQVLMPASQRVAKPADDDKRYIVVQGSPRQ